MHDTSLITLLVNLRRNLRKSYSTWWMKQYEALTSHISHYELLQSIHDLYITFKREKRMKEKVAIAQRLR